MIRVCSTAATAGAPPIRRKRRTWSPASSEARDSYSLQANPSHKTISFARGETPRPSLDCRLAVESPLFQSSGSWASAPCIVVRGCTFCLPNSRPGNRTRRWFRGRCRISHPDASEQSLNDRGVGEQLLGGRITAGQRHEGRPQTSMQAKTHPGAHSNQDPPDTISKAISR